MDPYRFSKLADELVVDAETQPYVGMVYDDAQPVLGKAYSRRLDQRAVRACQRLTAPQSERLPEMCRRQRGPAARQRGPAGRRQVVECPHVDLVILGQLEQVAGRACEDPSAEPVVAEDSAQR